MYKFTYMHIYICIYIYIYIYIYEYLYILHIQRKRDNTDKKIFDKFKESTTARSIKSMTTNKSFIPYNHYKYTTLKYGFKQEKKKNDEKKNFFSNFLKKFSSRKKNVNGIYGNNDVTYDGDEENVKISSALQAEQELQLAHSWKVCM
jgi:uncharacterized membrane protein